MIIEAGPIHQPNPLRGSRSAVGTMTAPGDPLKLLLVRAARRFSTGRGSEGRPDRGQLRHSARSPDRGRIGAPDPNPPIAHAVEGRCSASTPTAAPGTLLPREQKAAARPALISTVFQQPDRAIVRIRRRVSRAESGPRRERVVLGHVRRTEVVCFSEERRRPWTSLSRS